ncbi:hypothetical protein ACFQV8_14945 [Pseudonocardia benzenivorans]
MSATSGVPARPDLPDDAPARVRLLQAAALTSTFDRFALAPLLIEIGRDLGVSLAAVAAVASGYYLAYGLMQPLWGCSATGWAGSG